MTAEIDQPVDISESRKAMKAVLEARLIYLNL